MHVRKLLNSRKSSQKLTFKKIKIRRINVSLLITSSDESFPKSQLSTVWTYSLVRATLVEIKVF